MTLVYTPVPEILVVGEKKIRMFLYPPVPEDHPRILSNPEDEILGVIMFDGRHCSRRYQGTWEIRSGRLYLKDLAGRIRLKKGRPILAKWFSGALLVPKRTVPQYIRTGLAAVHQKDALMAFKRGVAVPVAEVGKYELPYNEQAQVNIEGLAEFDVLSELLRIYGRPKRSSRIPDPRK